jgi:hypothetical protein
MAPASRKKKRRTAQESRTNALYTICLCFFFIFGILTQYFSYIMATSFSGGRSRSIRIEPPTMDKKLVNFITCSCESSPPFFVIDKGGSHAGANPRCIGDKTSNAKIDKNVNNPVDIFFRTVFTFKIVFLDT